MTELFRSTGIHKVTKEKSVLGADELAVETLLQLRDANGTFVQLLGTPTDLKALFVGHCIAEGLSMHPPLSLSIEHSAEEGYVIESLEACVTREQNVSYDRVVSTSCGACNSPGIKSLNEGLGPFNGAHRSIDLDSLNEHLSHMRELQIGFKATGGMHGAGLWVGDRGLVHVAEDIGRHNAVDKVIGHAYLQQSSLNDSVLLLSGRCGWDIVAKASRAGIGSIGCIGACSSLAAETARALNMRIFSFVKADTCVAIGRI